MNIDVGMEFKNIWIGHESCNEGRVFKVKKIIRGCTCPDYISEINGKPQPRRPHVHIEANIIKCPFAEIDSSGFWFGPFDEDTLHDIDDPDNSWIEPIYTHGIQLSLF